MRVPFVDLRAQYQSIKNEVDLAIAEVVESASFALGPAVEDFENKFAQYVGVKNAIGVNSGTSALHLALLAVGVGPGDEVIAPAMTFVATVAAIEYTGAKPVLVDIDPESYTMDPKLVANAITDQTKAIIPVHLYGHPADMNAILDIAKRHGLIVVEDTAQAHGAEYNGHRCGALGDIAAFSFYPGKNLGAYGEGGAVTTDGTDLADTVRQLRDWGQETKGHHAIKGYNCRMDGIQGAVLGVKMNHIEAWTEARRRVASHYTELMKDLAGVTIPANRDGCRHVYHIYAILVQERDRIREQLAASGIACGIHYPLPVHLQPCLHDLGYSKGGFPVAEKLADSELSLPIYPELTNAQVAEVGETLRKIIHE